MLTAGLRKATRSFLYDGCTSQPAAAGWDHRGLPAGVNPGRATRGPTSRRVTAAEGRDVRGAGRGSTAGGIAIQREEKASSYVNCWPDTLVPPAPRQANAEKAFDGPRRAPARPWGVGFETADGGDVHARQLGEAPPREPAALAHPCDRLTARLGLRKRVVAKEGDQGRIVPHLDLCPATLPVSERLVVYADLCCCPLLCQPEIQPPPSNVVADRDKP